MGISIYKIKKWYKMLTVQSILHVNQGIGTCYSNSSVAGYYNDLTEKVQKDNPDILVPEYYIDNGDKIYFSIGIFQYGLGSYDLLLKENNDIYKDKLLACADWAVENQQEDGSWVTFSYKNTKHIYSSMAQGEGISMLIRAYIITKNEKFLYAIHKAKDFMLRSIENGGVTEYFGDEIFFYEYTDLPVVLNGWIFSIWGLYDYYKYFKDKETQIILEKSLASLKHKISDFDIGYWSKYNDGDIICSPFYHKLHIAQLLVMYELFGDEIYKNYAEKWELYQKSFLKRNYAFLKKTMQKLFE